MKTIILNLLMSFGGFWKKLGANPDHLRSILETKILMDGRRSSSFNVQKKGKELNHSDLMLSFMYLLFGGFGLAALIVFEGKFSGYVGFMTLWIIILLITLITDFTDVLIDVRDNYILLPTPISGKTLALSRTLHLVLYLSSLIIPFIIPALIYTVIVKGILFALLFVLQFILAQIFTIFLVNIIYLLLLNMTSGQKFKDIINYFQIGFSIFIFSCYYVLPRLIDIDTIKDFEILEKSWLWLMPGSYFAALPHLVFEGANSQKLIILSVFGLILPFGGIYLVVNVLSKNFAQKLLNINIKGESKVKVESGNRSNYMYFWDNLINKNATESVGFRMSWLMTARSRMYKLRTYPMFGMLPAFFIYFAMDKDGNVQERFNAMQDGNYDLMLLYFALFAVITPLTNTKFSEAQKAATIFKALPIKNPGLLIRGNCNAILIKFGIPTFLFCSIVVLSIFGVDKWINIFIAFGNAVLVIYMFTLFVLKNIPFSESWDDQSKGSNTVKIFVVMFFLSFLGFGHYFLFTNGYILFLGLYFICSLFISFQLYKTIGKLRWYQVQD